MKTSEQIDKIMPALLAAQKVIKTPNKADDGKKAHTYKYVPLDAILDAVREPLNENGIVLLQSQEHGDPVAVTTRLVHAESGQWVEGQAVVPLEGNTPQKAGAAQTYARRYSLSALLGMYPPEEDKDGKTDEQATPIQAGGKPESVQRKEILEVIRMLRVGAGLSQEEAVAVMMLDPIAEGVTLDQLEAGRKALEKHLNEQKRSA